jgi:murein DD-endopeptidase MepM/ murein hydrolase activator NlpD
MTGYGANVPPPPAYGAPGYGSQPAPPVYEAPPPATAPVAPIEGEALPPPGGSTYAPPPAYNPPPPPTYVPPPVAGAPTTVSAGAAYVIQPGDTISGVGRRFQTPVQILIDLNGLGPRGAITQGQSIILPDSAVDTGPDPYATGPTPTGVLVPENGAAPPPPPPPPSGNPASPPPPREPASSGQAGTASPGSVALQWPVRGEIVRRFGPVGLGERNNGINIGAPAGAAVVAAADGVVGYVGDDLPGQGLTVLITHRSGWRTVYGHLGSSTVQDGQTVRAGQQIGTVGLTAGDGRPSIHFETRRMQGDEPVAIDPLTVLPR